jgi:hypothetical protein
VGATPPIQYLYSRPTKGNERIVMLPHNILTPTQKSNTPSINFRPFVKRPKDLPRFIRKGYLRDAYAAWLATAHPDTRTSVVGVRDMAKELGVDYSTAFRYKVALVRLGVMISTPRIKEGCVRSRLTNQYTFPILDENFLLERCQGGTGKNARVKQDLDLKQTTTQPAPEARMYENLPVRIEPERPRPDPEVYQAEQQARELRQARAARQATARQRRYAEAKAAPRLAGRSQRHHAPPAPIHEAACQVLRLCGMSERCYQERVAIAGAMEREGGNPLRHVEAMTQAWLLYQDEAWKLYMPCGMRRFFDTGLWLDKDLWRYDRDYIERRRRNPF